jgi:hypothetical protein
MGVQVSDPSVLEKIIKRYLHFSVSQFIITPFCYIWNISLSFSFLISWARSSCHWSLAENLFSFFMVSQDQGSLPLPSLLLLTTANRRGRHDLQRLILRRRCITSSRCAWRRRDAAEVVILIGGLGESPETPAWRLPCRLSSRPHVQCKVILQFMLG